MQSPSETVQDGSRVCIQGLQAKPELNGRKGVVRGAFRQDSGRWTVEIDADDKGPNVQVSMRPANLKVCLGTCPLVRESDAVSHASVPNVDQKRAGQIPQLSTQPSPQLPLSHSRHEAAAPLSMSCKAKFNFLKGLLQGREISHEFDGSATVAHVKKFLTESHQACDSSQSLVLVWEEQNQKLNDDCQVVSSLGPNISITVNVVKKRESAAAVTGASFACVTESGHSPMPPSTSAASSPPFAAALQEGSRVRIEGLQAKPELNGRTGVVCGAISQESGRWTVQIDADGARVACRGAFRAANLQVIPSLDFGTEWVDEEGRVWSKNVDFSRECAKGHALAPLGDCGGDGGGMRLMCRLCHSLCGRNSDEAASWLTCSVVAGCCGGYAVCCSCVCARSAAAAVAPAGSDDFCTLVSCGVECCMMWCLTFGVAGRWTAVSVVAAVDVGRVAGPHDDVPVLSNVRATIHVAQPRQRDAAADGAGRHGAACGRCDVVHQPHVEQRVCRHA